MLKEIILQSIKDFLQQYYGESHNIDDYDSEDEYNENYPYSYNIEALAEHIADNLIFRGKNEK